MSLLNVRDLVVRFRTRSSWLVAVDGVDLELPEGATLGLVGESGSGKSSVARAIVGLVPAASGSVQVEGRDLTNARGDALRALRDSVQMVFQDPASSLNPRMTVGEMLDEAIEAHRRGDAVSRSAEADRLIDLVQLDRLVAERYPHQLSGGQRQRIAIARSLAARPKILILDEVTSSLDVSVQANILNLLRELQRELGLSYLFISHNLSVVRYMSTVTSVMYLGRVVENAETQQLFTQPRHPYTQSLVLALPTLGAKMASPTLLGEVPDPHRPPTGCRFHTRCPQGPLVHPEREACILVDPTLGSEGERRSVACHFPLAGSTASQLA